MTMTKFHHKAKHGWAIAIMMCAAWGPLQLVAGDLNAGCDIVLPEMECKIPNGGDVIDASYDRNMERFNGIVAFGLGFVRDAMIEVIETKVPGVGFAFDSFVQLLTLFQPGSNPVEELRKDMVRMIEDVQYAIEFSDDVETLQLDILDVVQDIKDYQTQTSEDSKLNQLRSAREHCESFDTKLHFSSIKPEARLAVLYEYCAICSMVFAQSLAEDTAEYSLILQERDELLENCANYGPALVSSAKANQEAFLPSEVDVTTNPGVCFFVSYTGNWNYKAFHGAREIVAFKNRGRCVPVSPLAPWIPGVELACSDAMASERRDFIEETENCYKSYNDHFKHINDQFYRQRVLTPSLYYKAALDESLATDTIRIRISGSNRILSLCDVRVYGVDGLQIPLYSPTESSNYYEGSYPNDAFLALDGSPARDPAHQHISCTHTKSSTNPWWQAKFAGGGQAIGRVEIVNREVAQHRLANAEILINNKMVGKIGDGTRDKYTIYLKYKIRTIFGGQMQVNESGAGKTVSASFAKGSDFQFIANEGAIAIKSKATNNYLRSRDGGIYDTQTGIGAWERFSMQYTGTANKYYIKSNEWQQYLGTIPGWNFWLNLKRPLQVYSKVTLAVQGCSTSCVVAS